MNKYTKTEVRGLPTVDELRASLVSTEDSDARAQLAMLFDADTFVETNAYTKRALSDFITTEKAHELDGTRLVSAAMEKVYLDKNHCTVNDELASKVDLMSFNQYVGWYDGSSEKCDRVYWTFDIDKPVFISEFGGGALAGLHGNVKERFTEEYQEELYIKNTGMLDRIPGLCGATPWILKDFRSPRRQLKDVQDDYNRKGLISDQGQKKKAFYVMQKWYESKT